MRELLLTNSRLDKRYDIVRELGRGSYAEIFLARDTVASPHSPHYEVVIKALNVFLQDDLDHDLERTLVENFQNEAIALDRVRHPNIISRLGHGTARDLQSTVFHYLVLEYLAGGDLQRSCRERSLTPKTAFSYIEQICAGLRHAHSHGIIHRDIKPSNLLLTKDRSTVKIADFGVARVHQSDAPITRVGTNIYAPPEHSPLSAANAAFLAVSELKPSADIYSLAKSIYTLLTGEAPRVYANSPITDLPITVRNEEWAEELKRVLNRATQDRPEERPQSIDEFWSDLAGLRKMIADAETATSVRPKLHTLPQARISKGYVPLAPRKPDFDTSRDLRSRHPLIAQNAVKEQDAVQPVLTELPHQPMARVENYWPQPAEGANGRTSIKIDLAEGDRAEEATGKGRRFLTRAAFAVLLLAMFGSLLYGTSVYLRSADPFGGFPSIFSSGTTAKATTDVNLRAGPSANSELIGLVTRDSRVRILRTSGTWHEVDVLEQGRQAADQTNVGRGWLNGRYVDME